MFIYQFIIFGAPVCAILVWLFWPGTTILSVKIDNILNDKHDKVKFGLRIETNEVVLHWLAAEWSELEAIYRELIAFATAISSNLSGNHTRMILENVILSVKVKDRTHYLSCLSGGTSQTLKLNTKTFTQMLRKMLEAFESLELENCNKYVMRKKL